MNPVTRVFRRSRAFRIMCYFLAAFAWVMIAFIALGSFTEYTQAGNVAALIGLMLFAAAAWWYGEDRDRRQADKKSKGDGPAPDAEIGR